MPIVVESNESVEVAVPPLIKTRLVSVRDAVIPGVADSVRVMVPVKLLRLFRVMIDDPDAGLTRIVCELGLVDPEKSETFTVTTVE